MKHVRKVFQDNVIPGTLVDFRILLSPNATLEDAQEIVTAAYAQFFNAVSEEFE